jgi:hypothetical protein
LCRRRLTFIPASPGDKVRYFEWMGAAVYTADHRAGAMHGKQFLLDSVTPASRGLGARAQAEWLED